MCDGIIVLAIWQPILDDGGSVLGTHDDVDGSATWPEFVCDDCRVGDVSASALGMLENGDSVLGVHDDADGSATRPEFVCDDCISIRSDCEVSVLGMLDDCAVRS